MKGKERILDKMRIEYNERIEGSQERIIQEYERNVNENEKKCQQSESI